MVTNTQPATENPQSSAENGAVTGRRPASGDAMTATPNDVIWTPREALACAYCWTEFAAPEGRDDTPETYWLSISARARMDCRRIANELLLLSVARNEAVAMPPPMAIRPDVVDLIGAKIGVKASHRMKVILAGVWSGLRSTRQSGANAETQSCP
jgi:hypothetical protein